MPIPAACKARRPQLCCSVGGRKVELLCMAAVLVGGRWFSCQTAPNYAPGTLDCLVWSGLSLFRREADAGLTTLEGLWSDEEVWHVHTACPLFCCVCSVVFRFSEQTLCRHPGLFFCVWQPPGLFLLPCCVSHRLIAAPCLQGLAAVTHPRPCLVTSSHTYTHTSICYVHRAGPSAHLFSPLPCHGGPC